MGQSNTQIRPSSPARDNDCGTWARLASIVIGKSWLGGDKDLGFEECGGKRQVMEHGRKERDVKMSVVEMCMRQKSVGKERRVRNVG